MLTLRNRTAAIVPPTTTAATAAAGKLRDSCIGIQREVVAGLERLDPASGGGDHRRIVRRKLGGGRGVSQGATKLRVRGHAADDSHAVVASVRGVAKRAHERPDDRVLIRRGEIGPSAFELLDGEILTA